MKPYNYKIRVIFGGDPQRGWIDSYQSARTAKAEVARINATTARTATTAEYLGDERRSARVQP